MKIYFISIFPEIFNGFLNTSIIQKSIEKSILDFTIINPRNFCKDKHKQIDDSVYGGGAGMLLKAIPFIDAVNYVIDNLTVKDFTLDRINIVYLSPSENIFCQQYSHNFSQKDVLIFVCGRYEGIDHRFELFMKKKYKNSFLKMSLGKFIMLGGELPAMTIVESVVRLIPGVIKEQQSWIQESYSIDKNMNNIEHPQYTRPESVLDMKVPDVLLSGNHKKIKDRKDDSEIYLNNKLS